MIARIKTYLKAFGLRMLEARQKSVNSRIAMMQLHRMTDKELHDIGICRGDIKRVSGLQK